MRFFVRFLIVTYFILLSPLVTSCAEGDGFLIKAPPPNNDWLGWQSLVNPALQKSYEELQKRCYTNHLAPSSYKSNLHNTHR